MFQPAKVYPTRMKVSVVNGAGTLLNSSAIDPLPPLLSNVTVFAPIGAHCANIVASTVNGYVAPSE